MRCAREHAGARGYGSGMAFRSGERCRSCGARAWQIGRVTAECARCGHAEALDGESLEQNLPLAHRAR